LLKALVLIVVAIVGLTTPVAPGDNAPVRDRERAAPSVPPGHYSKDTPYAAPKATIKAPPEGYAMIFIENIGRHGSRASVSPSVEKHVLKVWENATEEEALRTVGKALAADVKSLQAAEKKIGYGNLSTRGKAEWKGIGTRTAVNYPTFFKSLQGLKLPLDSITTPIFRTKQSIAAFESGLTTKYSKLALGTTSADKDLVRFDSEMSEQGAKDLDAIMKQPDVVTASTSVLKRIYRSSYVESLDDPVGEALDIYALYCIAAGMSEDTTVTFNQYVDTKDAAVLAYARDAEKFYRYGPGVKGENITYKNANLLLQDFFDALDARIDGGTGATVFRVAHGETTMPFAALLQLPGSEKQATKGTPYTYSNNPWRGDKAGGMAGNIEWVAYRERRTKSIIVTMRYNEKPVPFRRECKPISKGSYFYTPTELKRCLPTS